MATQSLYRRYRPRRFSELKGQDHIVRALRTSVAEGREGQAYLFSGPRGTGKTSTARIMAKVLNCENPQDGEPCCSCASCLSVEHGTSYDVHELDAASNNGVDAMRDLIEKASLGTPGRHKVYILDEVHMLSKGAEAALLKTLEEPPPHVVFVLATTDPQKMSDTIRSRTQHLQFHLLGPDTLQEHVRWVADDAGLTVTDDAIEQVIAQGAGSPRDTLSALELASNAGGGATEVVALDDFVEAMIEQDPGRGLKLVAHAVSRGRDPRTITEELIGYLRNGFLALMAPELVQLPSQRLDALTDLAQRAGAARLVRGIEQLGEALTEMRHAPDPRVLLDVATVQLTSEQVGDDVGALVSRIQRLERQVAAGVPVSGAGAPAAAPAPDAPAPAAPAPVDPATGRTKLGSRVASTAPDQPQAPTSSPAPAPSPEVAQSPEVAPSPAAPVEASVGDAAPVADAAPAPAAPPPATVPGPAADPSPPSTPAAPTRAPDAAPERSSGQVTVADWETVRPTLRGMARAVFSPATLVASAPGSVTLGLPNDTHRTKCEQHRSVVEEALTAHAGAPITIDLVVDDGGGGADQPGPSGGGGAAATVAPAASPEPVATQRGPLPGDTPPSMSAGALAHDTVAEAEPAHLSVVRPAESGDGGEPVTSGRAIAEQARARGPEPDPEEGLQTIAESLPDDDEVDVDDLVDAPPEAVKTPVDRLAEAFPGSELIDDPY